MAIVLVSLAAQRQIDELSESIRVRVFHIIKSLEAWPNISGAKPLRGQLSGKYRKRTGDYRIVFSVKGQTLLIEKAGHRKDIYEE